jgi:hypothetical protein
MSFMAPRVVQVGLLEQADAVFGGDAAAEPLDDLADEFVDPVATGLELRRREVGRFEDVQVHVPVADVPEPDHLEIGVMLGDDPLDRPQELRQARN